MEKKKKFKIYIKPLEVQGMDEDSVELNFITGEYNCEIELEKIKEIKKKKK